MKHDNFSKDSAEKNNIKVECPHCKKTGNKPIMARHHFDYCKYNPSPDKPVRPPMKRKSKATVKEAPAVESDLTRAARFKAIAKEFEPVAKEFAKELDETCHPEVQKLIRKAYSTAALSDVEVIRAKMLFQHIPISERPMLFRVPTP